MNDRIDRDQVELLIQGYIDGSLTDPETIRLHDLLRQDPDSVNELLEGLRDDCLIRSVVAEVTVAAGNLKRSERDSVRWCKWLRVTGSWRNLFGVQKPAVVFALTCLAVMIAFLLIRNTNSGPTVTVTDASSANLLLTRAGIIQNIGKARLRAGDLLSTASNSTAIITYAGEQTRLRLGPNTEIAVLESSKAKRFGLHHGKIDATVGHQPSGTPMIWQTAHATVTVVGTEFTLHAQESSTTLQVIEGKVNFTAVGTVGSIQLTNGQYCNAFAGTEVQAKSFPGGRGTVLRECWTNLEGFHVGDLTSERRYHDSADVTEYLRALAGPQHWGANYGERLRGYLYPPVTGDYQFWICGSDSAQLWLSSDESAGKIQMIASVNLPVAVGQWEKFPWQKSYPIKLEAGRKYYFEVLHKAGNSGNDHCSVAWRIPAHNREIVTGGFLSPVILEAEVRQ